MDSLVAEALLALCQCWVTLLGMDAYPSEGRTGLKRAGRRQCFVTLPEMDACHKEGRTGLKRGAAQPLEGHIHSKLEAVKALR